MAERRYNRAPWEGASRRGAALSRVMREMNPPRTSRWIMRPTDYSYTQIMSVAHDDLRFQSTLEDYTTELVFKWVDAYDTDGNHAWSMKLEEEQKYEPNLALVSINVCPRSRCLCGRISANMGLKKLQNLQQSRNLKPKLPLSRKNRRQNRLSKIRNPLLKAIRSSLCRNSLWSTPTQMTSHPL